MIIYIGAKAAMLLKMKHYLKSLKMCFTSIRDDRIQAVLAQKNIHVNTKRISRLMSERDLIPKDKKSVIAINPAKINMKNVRIF